MTRALDKHDKRIIRMFFVDKMNTAEIARAINRSEADVDGYLAREMDRRYNIEREKSIVDGLSREVLEKYEREWGSLVPLG